MPKIVKHLDLTCFIFVDTNEKAEKGAKVFLGNADRREIFAVTMNERILLAGYYDHKVFRDGWYDVERDPEGMVFRASRPKAVLWHGCGIGRYDVKLLMAARPEHSGEELRGRVRCGRYSFDFTLERNLWTLRKDELELEDHQLTIKVQTPWSPDRLYKNGDVRSLGILLSAVHLTPRREI